MWSRYFRQILLDKPDNFFYRTRLEHKTTMVESFTEAIAALNYNQRALSWRQWGVLMLPSRREAVSIQQGRLQDFLENTFMCAHIVSRTPPEAIPFGGISFGLYETRAPSSVIAAGLPVLHKATGLQREIPFNHIETETAVLLQLKAPTNSNGLHEATFDIGPYRFFAQTSYSSAEKTHLVGFGMKKTGVSVKKNQMELTNF